MTSIKPRSTSIVIYQGDDLATLAEMRQAAEASRRAAEGRPNRLGDEAKTTPEQDAYDAFVDEAAERAVVVEIQAIGRKRFAQLVAEHPPRKVDVESTDDDGNTRTTSELHPDDAQFDVNVETFSEALLMYADPDDPDVRTIVAPNFTKTADRQAFLDNDLSDGDFRDMWVAAYYLNRAPSADPKATRYSPVSPRSTGS